MATKTCPTCKTEQPSEYLFCAECGSPLPVAPAPVEEPIIVVQGHVEDLSQGIPLPETEQAVDEPVVVHEKPSVSSAVERPADEPTKFILARLARGGSHAAKYVVNSDGCVIGSGPADISFPEDAAVSPRHVRVVPVGDTLRVEDLGSHNGIYVRIVEPTVLVEGDQFICGDTVFRANVEIAHADQKKLGLYVSPNEQASGGTLTRILSDGRDGEVIAVRAVIHIGREDGNLKFPNDRFMSRKHAAVDKSLNGLTLSDQGSRNGTYIRRHGPLFLKIGDVFTAGRQILRIEANPE